VSVDENLENQVFCMTATRERLESTSVPGDQIGWMRDVKKDIGSRPKKTIGNLEASHSKHSSGRRLDLHTDELS
jgi:hypothetical protein